MVSAGVMLSLTVAGAMLMEHVSHSLNSLKVDCIGGYIGFRV